MTLNWQGPFSCRSRRGSILIIVLWSIFFLATMAVAVNAYVWPRINFADKFMTKAEAHYLAEAGVKRAMVEIKNDKTEDYDCLTDLWSSSANAFKDVALDGGTFSVVGAYPSARAPDDSPTIYGLIDEERKININKASYDVLKRFFEMTEGVPAEKAVMIAAAVVDWRDKNDDSTEDEDTEDGYYSTLSPAGYHCKNKDFEVLEELLLVRGMTYEIFNKVKDRLTVYTDGPVNINTADEAVLRGLGLSGGLIEKIARFRHDNAFMAADTIADTLNDAEGLSNSEVAEINKAFSQGLLAVRSDNFMGHSCGRVGMRPGEARITFVFNRNKKTIKYWREE
ncbi:MAG: hypothetical protein V1927_02680 [Candidatus Omnitrophota bacterium]